MLLNEVISQLKNFEKRFEELNSRERYCYNELNRYRNLIKLAGDERLLNEESDYTISTKRENLLINEIREIESKREKLEKLRSEFHDFGELTQNILTSLYIENKTWDCVQAELGISKSTISRYRKKVIKKLSTIFSDLER